MIVKVSAVHLMRLPPFHVFLMNDEQLEDSPCWTKLHGTLHVLETSEPSVVQPNSNHYQHPIQIFHSGLPAEEFL
jgi:hypothetical protein